MLDEFIAANRAEIISRCRAKVAARTDFVPPPGEIDRGVPMFLDQLLEELRHGPSADFQIMKTATGHGRDLLMQGYTVSQVVHDYGDVCQAITELAVERRSSISTEDFRTLNRCLDDAIAGAVTEYGSRRNQLSADDEKLDEARRAAVVRDLLKSIEIAQVAYAAIRSGRIGAAGSTGAVLTMGLDTAHDLAKRLLGTR